MKKPLVALSFFGAFLILFSSGCFLVDPSIKVVLLIENFKKYWEQEDPAALAGLYTDPAHINTATKTFAQIENTYDGMFSGRGVVSFTFISEKDIDFNATLTEADVQFTAVIDYTSGPNETKTYVWKVKRAGTRWLIYRSNNY